MNLGLCRCVPEVVELEFVELLFKYYCVPVQSGKSWCVCTADLRTNYHTIRQKLVCTYSRASDELQYNQVEVCMHVQTNYCLLYTSPSPRD